jgi:hypothetical protein
MSAEDLRGKTAGRPSRRAAQNLPATGKARASRASRKSRRTPGSGAGATVIMQARVDADFAAELIERDAPALGLEGISAVVREGLQLVHKRAREMAAAAEYDRFYGGRQAPLSDAVVPADAR